MKRGQMKRKFAVLGTLTCAGFLAISLSVPGQTQKAQTHPVAPQPAPGPKADAIYLHGNIYTGELANSQFSSILRAEAIAVRGGRIQAVGKASDIEKLKGPQTQVVDLGGHFVMPGFNDAHMHLADAGLQKLTVDLTGMKALDEMRERVLARVQTAKAGEWILGGGWDEPIGPVPPS